jgi:hypothetical protein
MEIFEIGGMKVKQNREMEKRWEMLILYEESELRK